MEGTTPHRAGNVSQEGKQRWSDCGVRELNETSSRGPGLALGWKTCTASGSQGARTLQRHKGQGVLQLWFLNLVGESRKSRSSRPASLSREQKASLGYKTFFVCCLFVFKSIREAKQSIWASEDSTNEIHRNHAVRRTEKNKNKQLQRMQALYVQDSVQQNIREEWVRRRNIWSNRLRL